MSDTARIEFPYRSDRTIKAVAPVDKDTGNLLDTAGDGATCSFKVFDALIVEECAVAAAASQLLIDVTNVGAFNTNQTLNIDLDDGTAQIVGITSINFTTGVITLASTLTDTVAVENRIRVIFGVAVTMSEFGTPSKNQRNWGFKATLPDTHASQKPDREIDIEIDFIGDVAGGLNARQTIRAIIKEADG